FAGRTPRQSKRGRYHEPGRSGGLDLSPRRITVRIYLGVDGGGSKTRFALIEQSGRVLARHEEGPAYYPQIGPEGLRTLLAYWIAREGLRLFSRMSDGRTPRGPLHAAMRRHFGLETDLDLCAAIYGKSIMQRSQFAQLSKVIAAAAASGDLQARELFDLAAR